jgi:transcriptional regulator with XRE-family HTH domain
MTLKLTSPFDVRQGLRVRARARRLADNLSQEGLAKRSGVSLGTLKHFERTGDVSLESLIALAFALNAEKEFETLFPMQEYRSIEDVIAKPTRKRGRTT